MKQILLAISFYLCCNLLCSQDILFSQFQSNPLYLNPALAGSSQKNGNASGRVVTNYTNQDVGSSKVVSGSWDQGLDKLHGGLGGQFVQYSVYNGFIQTSEVRGIYSYHINLGNKENQLHYGLQASLSKRYLNQSHIISDDPPYYYPEPDFGSYSTDEMKNGIIYPNAAMGIAFSNPKITAGIAAHNLLEPNISFLQNPDIVIHRRYSAHFGYHFQKPESKFSAEPQLFYSLQRITHSISNYTICTVGSAFNFDWIQTGIWYRETFGPYLNSDALLFSLGYSGNHFKLNFSYDKIISDGRRGKRENFEISLAYKWKTRQKSFSRGRVLF